MKIRNITEERINFNNGMMITYDHTQDCCETNYADFFQLENLAFNIEFDEELIFEKVDGVGFRFGSKGTPMFFVPCYSYQNGYYSEDVDIYFNGKHVVKVDGEWIDDHDHWVDDYQCMLRDLSRCLDVGKIK